MSLNTPFIWLDYFCISVSPAVAFSLLCKNQTKTKMKPRNKKKKATPKQKQTNKNTTGTTTNHKPKQNQNNRNKKKPHKFLEAFWVKLNIWTHHKSSKRHNISISLYIKRFWFSIYNSRLFPHGKLTVAEDFWLVSNLENISRILRL